MPANRVRSPSAVRLDRAASVGASRYGRPRTAGTRVPAPADFSLPLPGDPRHLAIAVRHADAGARVRLAVGLQRVHGNAFIQQVLAPRTAPASAIQRCGPTPCDCSPEQRAAAEGTLAPPVRRTLLLGSAGPDVADLQVRLNGAGADPPLEVDGRFGPLTRAAVVEYQSSRGLEPDGKVGPRTRAALDAEAPIDTPAVTPPASDAEALTAAERTAMFHEASAYRKAALTTAISKLTMAVVNKSVGIDVEPTTEAAVKNWLFMGASDPRWTTVLSAAIERMRANLGDTAAQHIPPESSSTCTGKLADAYAHAPPNHVYLCDLWFTEPFPCRRVVLIHEFFHHAGCAHQDPAQKKKDPAVAAQDCDFMAGLVSQLHSGSEDSCS